MQARVRKTRPEEPIPEAFGGKLKLWRVTRGMRQEDLAGYTGTDRTTIARYELGTSLPSNMRLFVLALRHYDCLHDALKPDPFAGERERQ
jgi:transcriptional regulator with XRE-family HTH domain